MDSCSFYLTEAIHQLINSYTGQAMILSHTSSAWCNM